MSAAALMLLAACGGGGGGSTSGPPAGSSSGAAGAAGANPAAQVSLDPALTLEQNLGKLIFNDTTLSSPRGVACASCHQAAQGGADNNGSAIGVVVGSLPTSIGLRNALTNLYSANTPPFGFVTNKGGVTVAKGGLFWDGRADTLAEQAQLPLLDALEMNNASQQAVVNALAAAPYAALFQQQYGAAIFSDAATAFTQLANAVYAYEETAELAPFTSKYDAVIQGLASFTPGEQNGLALFTDKTRANCAGCHQMNPNSSSPQDSIFTDYSYHANGIPRNSAIPSNADPSFYDLGLCGPKRAPPTLPSVVSAGVTISSFCGQFRTPSLRNAALRSRYMHNGFFTSLSDVVTFYSTRVSNPENYYGPAGVPDDLPAEYRGNLEVSVPPFKGALGSGVPVLTAAEVADLVAFLNTLTDGYLPQ